MKDNTKTYLRVAIYFIIAVALSAIFRLDYFEWYNNMLLPFGLTALVASVLAASGPIIGALIALRLTKKKPTITLYGTHRTKSVLMITLPILLFTICGAKNDLDLNTHYYGFIIGLSLALYGICEEYGWRGYLQNELINLKPIQKSLIIGTLWYLWHLSLLSKNINILDELKFFGILVFSSWGIGAIAEKTKSIIASACFHILGNILFLSSFISTAVDNETRYIIFGICLVVWILVVNTWNGKMKV